MSHKSLPKKITPCPIHEAILEIRYESARPREAIFGLVYERFRTDFPGCEKQPVLQIPEQIRTADPNLRHLPEFRLESTGFLLLVGPRTFALATSGEYCGWQAFSEKASEVLSRLSDLDLVQEVSRLGLRYINVFDLDIWEKSTLRIIRGEARLDSRSSQVTAQIPALPYEHTLRVANNVEVKRQSVVVGESIIDIDTAMTDQLAGFFDRRDELIGGAHEEEKKLFFSLLTDEYLASLNPEY